MFDGGTPGYVLYAASHLDLPFAPDLVHQIQRLSAPMGNFWELHDTQDPAWGTEKRRLWDSAVVLAGLVHHLFGITPTADGVIVNPKPPRDGWVECSDYRIGAHRLGMRATPTSLSLTWDGKTILDEEKPVGAVIRDGVVTKTFPRAAPALPSAQEQVGWPAQIARFVGGATPRFVILHDNAPNHARRIGVEILKHKRFVVPIEPLDRERLGAGQYGNAVIIAKSIPPAGDGRYPVVRQGSALQVWIEDTGHVWADTDPLVDDLVRFSPPPPPRGEHPMPAPNASHDLARRVGAAPSDPVRVQISSRDGPMLMACGAAMVEDTTSLDRRRSLQEMQAQREDLPKPFVLVASKIPGSVTELVVTAESDRLAWVTVTVTLPVTYWVVSSRGNPGWDRMADPVREYRDPDGSKRLVFQLHPGDGSARRRVMLTLTRLPTGEH